MSCCRTSTATMLHVSAHLKLFWNFWYNRTELENVFEFGSVHMISGGLHQEPQDRVRGWDRRYAACWLDLEAGLVQHVYVRSCWRHLYKVSTLDISLISVNLISFYLYNILLSINICIYVSLFIFIYLFFLYLFSIHQEVLHWAPAPGWGDRRQYRGHRTGRCTMQVRVDDKQTKIGFFLLYIGCIGWCILIVS